MNDPANPDHNMTALDWRYMTRVFNRYYPKGLTGKDVLDVGCNAGGSCFVAAELGARRVVGLDARQHWLDQAEFIHNIKYADSKSLSFELGDAKAMLEAPGTFDVVLFNGIFYHLPDPIHVLLKACSAAREMITVNTRTADTVPEESLVAWKESKTRPLSGIDGLAWLPGGPAAVRAILNYAGFAHVDVGFWVHGQVPGTGRMEVIGRR